MDILDRDELFQIALELDLPSLFAFCSTNRKNKTVCERDEFWRAKLRKDFPGYNIAGKPRESYSLLYSLNILKNKLDLRGNLVDIYKMTNLILPGIPELPKEIGKLVKLESLQINLSGLKEIPKEIGNLTKLTSLDLSYNDLTTLPKEIGNLKNLYNLNLHHNKLTSLPKEIANLTGLGVLNVSNNNLTSLPKEMENMSNLPYIYIYAINNPRLQLSKKMKNLKRLGY